MVQCLACKNRSSKERCSNLCLKTMIVCGQHARAKRPRFWYEENPTINPAAIRIQSLWRGFVVRNLLRLAGPGVLKRSVCLNDDELTTAEEKTRQHPFDYFGLEDGGQVYWFDQKTIIQWTYKKFHVVNPYTRTSLKTDDLRRIRELIYYRSKNNIPTYFSQSDIPATIAAKRNLRWLRIAQILIENNLATSPDHFIAMSHGQISAFLNFLKEDIRQWAYQYAGGRRKKYYVWISSIQHWGYQDDIKLSCDVAGILLAMLNEYKQNFELAFFIESAFAQSYLLWG